MPRLNILIFLLFFWLVSFVNSIWCKKSNISAIPVKQNIEKRGASSYLRVYTRGVNQWLNRNIQTDKMNE